MRYRQVGTFRVLAPSWHLRCGDHQRPIHRARQPDTPGIGHDTPGRRGRHAGLEDFEFLDD